MGKSTVLVTAASGNIGKATLQALSKYSDSLDVKAGVRDPLKSADLTSFGANISVIAADPVNAPQFAEALKGVDAAFFIAPGSENRAEIVVDAINAAKGAGLKHILVLSVVSAGASTIFGAQFGKVEAAAKSSGIPFTIIRLPNFLENLYGNAGSIKAQGTFYDGIEPDKPHTAVSVRDVGEVAAKILSDPAAYAGATYDLSSPPDTYANLAKYYSEVAGKTVTYTQVPYDGVRSALLGLGLQEWQVGGLLEVEKGVNAGDPIYSSSKGAEAIEAILGRPATTFQAWVQQAGAAFA